jgi:hypothetical protein
MGPARMASNEVVPITGGKRRVPRCENRRIAGSESGERSGSSCERHSRNNSQEQQLRRR